MIGVLQKYRELETSLWLARAEAKYNLSQQDELKFVKALDRCWDAMTDEEQATIEAERNAPPPGVLEEPNMVDREVVLGSKVMPRVKL